MKAQRDIKRCKVESVNVHKKCPASVLLLRYSKSQIKAIRYVPKGPAKSCRTLSLGREELKKLLPDCKHKLFSKIMAAKHNMLPKLYTRHVFALETGG